MNVRDPRFVTAIRLITATAVLIGVILDASGDSTVLSLLPYFTIQSSIAYGVFAAWAATRSWRGELSTPAPLKGAVTLYVTITGLVFHFVLDNPASGFAQLGVHRTPAEAVANQLLHTVVPLLAVLDWLLFDERGRYKWRYALYWLAFPLFYLGFALVRGLIVHKYPYPFLDVNDLGYGGVAQSAVFFALFFYLLALLFVVIDRVPAALRRRRAADQIEA
ncbi:Pr6Pr family membrane protein [Krasilnikovia sp. MM14-A1004]|uniref:Pr6Pr family membrane protein n=1 Tax=Krasilnikovia sp. MM14-A1004 TaxID=3373541 RepID=UPI00399C7B60